MKTRLNEDKRHVLIRLADKAVMATPIDPATEKRVTKAQKAYDKGHTALANEARKILAKAMPEADQVVLKRYDCLLKCLSTVFYGRHAEGHSIATSVGFFNDHAWIRTNGDPNHGSYDEREVKGRAYRKAEKASRVSVPIAKDRFTSTAKLIALAAVHKSNENELEMAEGADRDRRNIIMADFRALIGGARTYEDVLEVWPEAKLVADQIVGTGMQISVMSNEAKDRIAANMKARGVNG